ncbi:MAG: prolipoprotein diacylglyceryl transferase [archaeon]
MFIHTIDPTLFSLGPFPVRFYGIVYAVGFLFMYFYLYQAAKKGKIKNLKPVDVDWLVIFLIIGVLVGARFFEVVVYNPGYYWQYPLDILKIWQGGLSFHGALLGVFILTWLYSRKRDINLFEILDVAVIPLTIFLFLGRIANFVNGELWGTVTNVPWCVKFQGVEGCRHPSQIYESLKNLGLFFILFFTSKHKKDRKPGFIFWLFVLLYGIFRFVITFLRFDDLYWGLSKGQWLCVVMIILGAYMLYRMKKQKEFKVKKKEKIKEKKEEKKEEKAEKKEEPVEEEQVKKEKEVEQQVAVDEQASEEKND